MDLAAAIVETNQGAALAIRRGVVTQVSPLLVQVGAAATATPATALGPYVPVVGDIVSLLEQGPDRLVLGPSGAVARTAPTFTNSWVNYGAGNAVVTYEKAGGRVYLQGTMKNGTIGASAFTLPAGCRPVGTLTFVIWTASGASALQIDSAGQVVVATGSNTNASLDGVQFPVA